MNKQPGMLCGKLQPLRYPGPLLRLGQGAQSGEIAMPGGDGSIVGDVDTIVAAK